MHEQEIKKFSDEKLFLNLSKLFETEKVTSRLILLHLSEFETRRLYARRGHDSLFRMLVIEFKLSESSAYRRLQAMRLLREVPEAQTGLVTGELNLTTLSMAQSQIKREERLTGDKISPEKKSKIIESLKNKTQAEAEVLLFQQLPETASQPKTFEKRISKDTIRLNLNVPDRVLKKLKRLLQELWSHVNPNMDYLETIERSADENLKRIDPSVRKIKSTLKTINSREVKKQRDTALKKSCVTTKRATYFSVEVKRELHAKAEGCCQYLDTETKICCRSKFLLQIDHIVPVWAGGSNELQNLQLLCSTHNRLKYRVETNTNFVSDQMVCYG